MEAQYWRMGERSILLNKYLYVCIFLGKIASIHDICFSKSNGYKLENNTVNKMAWL